MALQCCDEKLDVLESHADAAGPEWGEMWVACHVCETQYYVEWSPLEEP